MPPRRLLAAALCFLAGVAAYAQKPAKTAAPEDRMIQRVVTARAEYQASLVSLYDQYLKAGDRERAKWVEEELRTYHLSWKPSYSLEIQDPLPESPSLSKNDAEANDLFRLAMQYKSKGSGTDYTLNMRRAEIILQDILHKHGDMDKLADVAYELGDLYESRAYKQYDRAARYFEHAATWQKGSSTDALIRAARLHDKQLNDRTKAIELYRREIRTDTDTSHVKEAERRLAELTSTKRP
jgi:hypothetical protein